VIAAMRCNVRNVLKDAHDDGAWACCWVPGSKSVLTGAVDETVKLWSSRDEGLVLEKTFHGQAGHTLGVVSVSVDPTGEWAASSALDSYIRVWSLKDQNHERALLESMPTEVWSVAFSPSKEKCMIAAAGGTTGTVKLWDISSMTPGIKSAPPEPALLTVVRDSRMMYLRVGNSNLAVVVVFADF
jgi:WD repeat-containing protein 61